MTDKELSQHGLQNLKEIPCGKTTIKARFSDKEPIYVGNKAPYFTFTANLISNTRKEKPTAIAERMCDCPQVNFSFNGIGCTCGGK